MMREVKRTFLGCLVLGAIMIMASEAKCQELVAKNTMTGGGHSVSLTCVPPVGGGQVTAYQFFRGVATGGPYVAIGTAQVPCSYVDGDAALLEGVTYYYVAQSQGPGGKSANSNEAAALIPFLPPNPPTGLQASPK